MSSSDYESSDNYEENTRKYRRHHNSEKRKKKKNELYNSLNVSKGDETKNNIKKTENDLSNEQDIKNITRVYKYITRTLETFIEKNYSNCKLVNNSLKTIYSHIKIFISSLNESKPKDKPNNEEDNNQKILYEIKIDGLNQQIKELKHELELLSTNESNKLNDGSPKKYKIYNYLKKKHLKLENKTKLDEYKYLLCIKEQQNRINDLENKLKLKILEHSKEVKESKCFPIITQYDLKEHVSPKLIPLTQTILKDTTTSSKRNISKLNGNKKDYFLTLTNSNSKTPYKMLYDKTDKEKREKNKKKGPKEVIFNSIDVKIKEEPKGKSVNKRNEADIHFNTLKLNSEIIPNKDKKFFISHPNLTIAGIKQRLNRYKIGIPNKLFSFKLSKNIDKDAFFKFPSTLNEIFVELEKLRIHTNNTDIINNIK